MLKPSDLIYLIEADDDGYLVTIEPRTSFENKFIRCDCLSCVADLLINIEKVLDLLNFDESEVLPDE